LNKEVIKRRKLFDDPVLRRVLLEVLILDGNKNFWMGGAQSVELISPVHTTVPSISTPRSYQSQSTGVGLIDSQALRIIHWGWLDRFPAFAEIRG
jgi:hypothetical protein